MLIAITDHSLKNKHIFHHILRSFSLLQYEPSKKNAKNDYRKATQSVHPHKTKADFFSSFFLVLKNHSEFLQPEHLDGFPDNDIERQNDEDTQHHQHP